MPHILLLTGSVRGTHGNSGALTAHAARLLAAQPGVSTTTLTLADPMPPVDEVATLLQSADGLLVVSGVYWGSYGSPLQRFVEVMTTYENSPAFFGKPVACALSMDSIGGFEVAARVHAVFAGLGCWSPPCSTLILSRVGLEAIAASAGKADDPNEDVWRLDDLEVVLHNLVAATQLPSGRWSAWPHLRTPLLAEEWPATGPLRVDTPRFL
jgi:NAD(P)H-dependent FMN reductase